MKPIKAIENFRNNLKDLMKEKDLNFETLGKETGIDSSSLRRWQSERVPKVESLVKIADYFGCSCDFLLGFTETFEFHPGKTPSDFYSRYYKLTKPFRFKDSKIAKLCGIGKGTVSKWRQGSIPDVYILVELCEILNCSFEYLIGRSDC